MAILFLGGCASTEPSRLYILNAQTTQALSQPSSKKICIESVHLPDHLQKAPIVTLKDENELAHSEFNRWGGSLRDNIEQVLTQNLSHLLQNDQIFTSSRKSTCRDGVRVEIWIHEMSGILGKSARLQARWILNGKALSFKGSETLQGDSHAEYVQAQSKLLAELSRAIAESIPADK
jgi:uncharacterized lipoprotein YmbA